VPVVYGQLPERLKEQFAKLWR
jgi:hypothetical protein